MVSRASQRRENTLDKIMGTGIPIADPSGFFKKVFRLLERFLERGSVVFEKVSAVLLEGTLGAKVPQPRFDGYLKYRSF